MSLRQDRKYQICKLSPYWHFQWIPNSSGHGSSCSYWWQLCACMTWDVLHLSKRYLLELLNKISSPYSLTHKHTPIRAFFASDNVPSLPGMWQILENRNTLSVLLQFAPSQTPLCYSCPHPHRSPVLASCHLLNMPSRHQPTGPSTYSSRCLELLLSCTLPLPSP